MSITDELREYTKHYSVAGNKKDTMLSSIADRIDVEHEEALSNVYTDKMDASGWVKLPKDADGEYIRVGDVLDGYGKTIEVVELRIGRSGWVIISRDGNGYADTFAFTHHHAPTVEDVLREMLDAWGELPYNATNEAIIAEYASKLRLAEEDE